MTPAILPCPFCGAPATIGDSDWVTCTNNMCAADGPACLTKADAVAAWNAAPRTPTPTAPPPNTVKVRVAVSVSPDGAWAAAGGSGRDDNEVLDVIHHDAYYDRLIWLIAHVPKPDPAAEVVAEVES